MKRIITLLQILFLCIFLGCGVYFGKQLYDRMQTEKEMESLQNLIQEDPVVAEEIPTDKAEVVAEQPEIEASPVPESREANGMLSRYYKLYEQNSDIAGWICVSGTSINYPVMHRADNNAYYLHRNFEKEHSAAGMLFLDMQCSPKGESDNMIIYGHNMRNGTMFNTLLDYEDKSFFNKYPTVGFDTMYDRGSWRIFAVFHTSVNSKSEFRYYQFVKAESKDEFDAYVSKCKELSLYDTGITPVYGQKLLALSTCSYNSSNERFVVAAVKE